jgi:hypothetical protein
LLVYQETSQKYRLLKPGSLPWESSDSSSLVLLTYDLYNIDYNDGIKY